MNKKFIKKFGCLFAISSIVAVIILKCQYSKKEKKVIETEKQELKRNYIKLKKNRTI